MSVEEKDMLRTKTSLKVRGSLFLFFLCFSTLSVYGAEPEKVRLAIGFIPHIQFASLYVGIEKGFYKQEGIDLLIQYGFGMDIFSLLMAEKIDLGLSDSDQLIIAGSKDLSLRAIFQYYQSYPVTILAKKATVSKPEEFVGKSIGTPEFFGTSYIGLLLFLDRYKLKDSVNMMKIGYSQISSLLADKVDGVVCFYNNEPLSPDLKGVETIQWDVKNFSDIVGASFITSKGIIDKKSDVLRRFVKATQKAISYTFQNQEEAVAISLDYIGPIKDGHEVFIGNVLKSTCELFKTEEGYGHLDENKYEDSIRIMVRLGLIPKEYPVEMILHPFE